MNETYVLFILQIVTIAFAILSPVVNTLIQTKHERKMRVLDDVISLRRKMVSDYLTEVTNIVFDGNILTREYLRCRSHVLMFASEKNIERIIQLETFVQDEQLDEAKKLLLDISSDFAAALHKAE